MYIAILGRQPALGMAELERIYGSEKTAWYSSTTALVDSDHFSVDYLGGTQKAGQIVLELPAGDWRKASLKIAQYYQKKWAAFPSKVTLGISTYGFDVSAREVQKTGIILKQKLKEASVSLRLIPNPEPALNTAVSHHNKLGLSSNKVELIVVKGPRGICVAESIGAQNITFLAKRDQGRPKRDAFVGMLPPKLAQIILNLAIGPIDPATDHCAVLDPFCGTGVILQEALLRGCLASGSDLNPKMIDYTRDNLAWLRSTFRPSGTVLSLEVGDATIHQWHEAPNVIDAIASEAYLGQPFSAPPSPAKLEEVRGNCNHIISKFLQNIGSQLPAGTPLCIAVPAWKNSEEHFTHLPLISKLESLGFTRHNFTHVNTGDLLYYRENQVVARELLVLVKK